MSQKVSRKHTALVFETHRDHEKQERSDRYTVLIEKLKKEVQGHKVRLTNSMHRNLAREMVVTEIRSDYQPGDFRHERTLILISDNQEESRIPVPSDMKIAGNRITLEFARTEDESINIKRTFKTSTREKSIDDLEIYIEILN